MFYYVVSEDITHKLSATTSDTIGYPAYVCPLCQGEIGPDNYIISNENNSSPKKYSILNYPNPFNPVTKIYYELPKEGNVKITVYNSVGQEIKILVNEFKQVGSYKTEFDGSNLSSGIYFYRIEAGSFIQTMKMLLIK